MKTMKTEIEGGDRALDRGGGGGRARKKAGHRIEGFVRDFHIKLGHCDKKKVGKEKGGATRRKKGGDWRGRQLGEG